jgi:hypothetical protein
LGIPSDIMTTRLLRIATAALLPLSVASWWSKAYAYRPFEGTDAAVADPGEVEIELGPVQYMREGSERTIVAPAVTLNYGFADGWEASLEGELAHGVSSDSRRTSLVGNGAFLKGVLRKGSLQNQSGPSIATEFGLLLPGINDEPGTGGSIAGIVSQRWSFVTIHFNAAAAVTREHHGDLFVSTIIEGPDDWPVRPAAEVFYERDFGGVSTISGLIGAIWQLRDNLAVDVGFRGALTGDHTLNEFRAGLTFSFPPQ